MRRKKARQVEDPPPRPKRKRARRARAGDDGEGGDSRDRRDAIKPKKVHSWGKKEADRYYKETEKNKYLPTDKTFTARVVIPRINADLARRLGDPAASPRDYYCDCPKAFGDWLPVCQERKANCRLAGRTPSSEPWPSSPRVPEKFKAVYERYRGRVRPRSVKPEEI